MCIASVGDMRAGKVGCPICMSGEVWTGPKIGVCSYAMVCGVLLGPAADKWKGVPWVNADESKSPCG
jgi:hypothetical protein